jgi:hypothetical protein
MDRIQFFVPGSYITDMAIADKVVWLYIIAMVDVGTITGEMCLFSVSVCEETREMV